MKHYCTKFEQECKPASCPVRPAAVNSRKFAQTCDARIDLPQILTVRMMAHQVAHYDARWFVSEVQRLLTMRPNAKLIGYGRHRAVFDIGGKFVVKIPLSMNIWHPNCNEAHRWRMSRANPDPDGIRYARCRLFHDWLLMEKLDFADLERPDWAAWVDCGQVGRSRSGHIVAYDFG